MYGIVNTKWNGNWFRENMSSKGIILYIGIYLIKLCIAKEFATH